MPVSKLEAGRVNLFERGSKREREQDSSGDDNHKKSKADTSLLSATSEAVSYTHLTLPTICSV